MSHSPAKKTAILFIVVFIFYSFFLLILWPGIITVHGMAYLQDLIVENKPFPELTLNTALYDGLQFFSIRILKANFLFSFVAHIMIASAVITYACYLNLFRFRMLRLGSLLALFTILLPSNIVMLFESEREVLFSWLIALYLLQLIDFATVIVKNANIRISLLAFTSMLITAARPEGLIYAFFIPISVWQLSKNLRLAGMAIFVIFIFHFSAFKLIPNIIHSGHISRNLSDNYLVSQSLMGIARIIFIRGEGISPDEAEVLQPNFHTEIFTAPGATDDIAKVMPAIKHPTGDNYALHTLTGLYWKLIRENPKAFLQIKLHAFFDSFSEPSSWESSSMRPSEDIKKLLQINDKHPESYFPFLLELFADLQKRTKNIGTLFFGNATGLLIFIAAILLTILKRHLILPAIPLLAHLSCTIALQQYGKPKYVYIFSLLPLVLLPYLIYHFKNKPQT